MTQHVLILGGSGRFGRNASEAFKADGWQVHQFDRNKDDLMQATAGMDVIINAWNPAYDKWADLLPGLHASVIRAAKASGAMVIIPGNVYVFGKDAPERFAPDTPHAAKNMLGRLRIDMETAYRASNVQTLILRAGDFLDTTASGNWFDLQIANKAEKGVFTYPGQLDAIHAWAFLPDLTRAVVALANMRSKLGPYEDIPFPGYTLTGTELHKAAQVAMGRDLRLKQMSWLPLYFAAPFWKVGRRLLEMRYLWNKPHYLDKSRFDDLLPDFVATPLPVAMKAALEFQINPD